MRKKILVGVTAAAVVLSSGVIAFAATDTSNSQIEKGRPSSMSDLTETQREAVQQASADSMKEAIAELIDSGTITQDEADQLTERTSSPKDKNGTDTLTEEQRTALHEETSSVLTEEQKSTLNETVKAKLESKLADLVSEGTITQDQADQLMDGKGGLHMGSGGRHGRGFGGQSKTDEQSAETQDTTI